MNEWVRAPKWCEITGDTIEAVRARGKAGKWVQGEQYDNIDGKLWVHVPTANAWLKAQRKHRQASRSERAPGAEA